MNQHLAARTTFMAIAVASCALAEQPKLPPLKRQPTAEAVVKEHVAAINACDWNRILAQNPDDVEIFSPDGEVAKGRQSVTAMSAQVVKPFREGGICGLKFSGTCQ